MRKIFYYSAVLLLNVSLSYAATWDNLQLFKWPTCTVPQNGWRVGIGIGLEYMNAEARVKSSFPSFKAPDYGDRKLTQKRFQVAPSLELGLTSFNNYYVGFVANWRYTGAATKSSTFTMRDESLFTYQVSHKFKTIYSLNILSKLGYKITPKFMIFTLVGPSITKWSHTTDLAMSLSGPTRYSNTRNTFQMSSTSLGAGVGLGFEYVFYEKWALGFDCIHHFYKNESKSKHIITPKTTRIAFRPHTTYVTKTISKKVSLSSDTVALRLTYFF